MGEGLLRDHHGGLQEAIDDWAEQKGAELLDTMDSTGVSTHLDRLAFSRDEKRNPYHALAISVQVRHHNQWVRAYRVEDGR